MAQWERLIEYEEQRNENSGENFHSKAPASSFHRKSRLTLNRLHGLFRPYTALVKLVEANEKENNSETMMEWSLFACWRKVFSVIPAGFGSAKHSILSVYTMLEMKLMTWLFKSRYYSS